MPARNTLVQQLALYTNPESQNAERHRQTDRWTDGRQDYANSRSYCVEVYDRLKMSHSWLNTRATNAAVGRLPVAEYLPPDIKMH